MASEYTFSTPCGHHGTIKPVRSTGGKYSGHWIAKIKGPKVTGSSGIKTVFSQPNLPEAQASIARYLRTQSSQVNCASAHATSVQRTPRSALVSPVKLEHSTYHPPTATSTATANVVGNDVWEASPNSMAKCRTCFQKIQKGELRVGKYTYNAQYNKYHQVYYHDRCVSAAFKASLRLPDPTIEQNRGNLLNSRGELRERLRELRLAFARRLAVPAYCIFDDKTIDDITVQLPQTQTALMACHGIKEKRCRNFGSAILTVTRRSYNNNNKSTTSSNQYYEDDDDDDNNDTIVVGETLSCEEIVNQKFQHAEANGYVISL